MKIWVDADACPKVIKEILFRAAERTKMECTLVSNQYLRIPNSEFINEIQVPGGFDIADEYIVQHLTAGDLVISEDIPMAAEVVKKGAIVLSPRGRFYDEDTIGEALTIRNMMSELRSSGVETGGVGEFKAADRAIFANQLDKILARKNRK